MSQVEAHYDNFQSLLQDMIKNVDVNLMLKIMYLERKLPDAPPRVDLDIEFKSGTNLKNKDNQLKAKYGFPSSVGEHGISIIGKMNMSLVEAIASDPDVVKISGRATPASYCI